MPTSRSNMMRLRSGLIGSISAWLPSRRSTAHHMGARSTTRSGHVRSKGTGTGPNAGLPPGTSLAKGRYRLTGIDVVRWVFHAGWPALGGPDGLLMLRTELKASGESGAALEKVVTVIAPGVLGGTPKRSRPAHREHPRREAGLDQTPSRRPRRSTRCTLTTVASRPVRPKRQDGLD